MKKRLLPIILFAVLSLVGCKGGKSSSSSSVVPPDSSSTITGTISITNKDELTAEWKATEAGRNVKLAVQPNTNITQAVSKGEITITSSDATVVAANGLLLTPLKEGSATITATYVAYNVSDTVTITVLPAATEPDVITGATLKQILEAKLIHTQLYEIEVEITGYQSGKTDFTKYGNFMVKDSSVTDSVLVYGATAKTDAFTFDGGVYTFANPQDFLTNEVTKGIKIGDTVKMRVDYFEYSTTPELEGIVLEVKAAAVIPATSIAITAPTADVEVGFKTSLAYTYEPATANDYAVTWSVNDDSLAYIDSSKGDLYGKKTGTVTVTAALKSNPEVKGTLNVEIKAASLTEPEYLKALPTAETEVALGVLQTNTHKQYYALSELSDRYLKTTEISTSAHKFRVVPVEGGVNVKVDDTKYLGLGLNTDNKAAVLISETAYLFKWNDIANTLTGTIGEDTYYMGTYGTYNTVSVSKLDYLIKEGALVYGQCPLRLYAGKLPDDGGEGTSVFEGTAYTLEILDYYNSLTDNKARILSLDLGEYATATVTATDDNSGKMYKAKDGTFAEWRMYASGNASVTLTAKSGYTLTGAIFLVGTKNYTLPAEKQTMNVSAVDGSIVLTNKSNFQIGKITVYYKVA